VKVADVMTTDVLSVRPGATLKDVARMLAARAISGMPVVDEDGHVLGVISEADILAKERRPKEETLRERLLGRRDGFKRDARTVGEAMTSPAVTIEAHRWIDGAAALMLDGQINRLPVVDRADRLVGIVTRADLVRAFAASDERIEREIVEEVLRRELWLDPSAFEVAVSEGEVELAGHVESEAQAELLRSRVRLVPGVVSVQLREEALR
jgi:CBS domain-containing protein